MRFLALLLVIVSAQAAEIETITLADGRVLVGELTPKGLHGGIVALVEPKGAAVSISMDDVKGREKWQAPQLVAYAPGTEPAPKAKAKAVAPVEATAKPGRVALLDDEIAAAQRRCHDAEVVLRELQEKRFHALIEEQQRFIKSGDISTVAVSAKAGASAADAAAVQRAVELNFTLERIGRMRESLRNHGSSGDWNLELGSDFWDKYTEFKHLPRPY